MEKNIAILMADLSGYTALTETHGSVAAADIIDRYIAIVENCLVGDRIPKMLSRIQPTGTSFFALQIAWRFICWITRIHNY